MLYKYSLHKGLKFDLPTFNWFIVICLVFSPTTVLNSPRVGSENIASIAITANDNANGVLQLSASEVTVSEESMTAFINVTRTAGAFGLVSAYKSSLHNQCKIVLYRQTKHPDSSNWLHRSHVMQYHSSFCKFEYL